jgi:hypothetical protein
MVEHAEELATLATMSPAQLRAEWRRVYRASPPRLTPDLLMRGIAHRPQERRYGGLTSATLRELDRLAAGIARGEVPAVARERQLKPGTRLVRQWAERTHVVLVTDNGYVFEDRRITSLSQIATTISGAHWSGPRFFGLKRRAGVTGAAAVSASRARADAAEHSHG